MKILLVSVGKPKDRHLDRLVDSYVERSRQFCAVDRCTVKEYSAKYGIDRIKCKETENILKVLRPRDHVILLDEKGDTMNSKNFAAWLRAVMDSTPGRLVFVVGGAFGVDNSLHERADMVLSLSPMTFTHDLCPVFLAEQIYRGLSIIGGTSYHH